MDRRKIYSCLCTMLLYLSYGNGELVPSNLYSLNLVMNWDGTTVITPDIIPATFSLGSADGKSIIVTFNSTLFMDLEKNTLNPEVFGIMFKGEENRYVQIQVDSANAYFVKLFNGFNNELEIKEKLEVDYTSISKNNTWNGTITVPVGYLPRATNEIAAYANFTTTSSHKTEVLSIRSFNSSIKEILPNMHKEAFFQEIDLQKYLPNVSQVLINWSSLWQELLHVTPGGSPLHPNMTVASHSHDDGHNAAAFSYKFPFVMILSLLIFIHSL